jgi:hypothetical protein
MKFPCGAEKDPVPALLKAGLIFTGTFFPVNRFYG